MTDSVGNLYGTTVNGGGSCRCGVVFKLTPHGEETVLHVFGGPTSDGNVPGGGLIRDEAGNFYGLTALGGANDAGTVYKLSPDGQETVLHSFVDSGASPWGELARDGAGNLFGVTNFGGTAGQGSVFKLTSTGREVVLHSFSEGEDGDGSIPRAGPILDEAGILYGTTQTGGNGIDGPGTVYRIKIRQ
jgi:uncharacterized repeat protein (TIGR03803 family)